MNNTSKQFRIAKCWIITLIKKRVKIVTCTANTSVQNSFGVLICFNVPFSWHNSPPAGGLWKLQNLSTDSNVLRSQSIVVISPRQNVAKRVRFMRIPIVFGYFLLVLQQMLMVLEMKVFPSSYESTSFVSRTLLSRK